MDSLSEHENRSRTMRLGMMMAALTTVFLAGCGAQGLPSAAVAAGPSALAAQGATGAFTQVLNAEWERYQPLAKAVDAWAQLQHMRFTMQPGNVVHDVTGAAAGATATRALGGGKREIVGFVNLNWHRPNSYEWADTTRTFRAIEQADGTITDIRLTGTTLDGVTIVKPRFAPADAATAKALMAKVDAFLHQPAQADWITGDLWGAVAGESKTHTFVLEEVSATAGDFGAFGRLIRYKGTLMNGDRPVPGYTHTTMEAVTDRAGRVIAAGDPTH
jgi:hypothetical protein